MMRINIFCFAFLFTLLCGCSSQWHLRRAIAKDPEILKTETIKIDTTIVTDSIIARDTLILKQIDTIETIKNRVKIKITKSFDTVRVEVECPPDTLRLVKEVPVEKLIYVSKKESWFKKILFNIAFAACIICIFALVFKKKS